MTTTTKDYTGFLECRLSHEKVPLRGGLFADLLVGTQDIESATTEVNYLVYFTNANYRAMSVQIIGDVDSTPTPPRVLSDAVLRWLCKHPGSDASHVAEAFRMLPEDAAEIVNGLLGDGLLELAE